MIDIDLFDTLWYFNIGDIMNVGDKVGMKTQLNNTRRNKKNKDLYH